MKKLLIGIVCVASLTAAQRAQALEATCGGGTDCGNIALTIIDIDSTHYEVEVLWRTSTTTLASSDWIPAIAIDSGTNIDVATSSVLTSAAGTWSLTNGPASNGDCGGVASSSLCADTTSTANLVGPGKSYLFSFLVETTTAAVTPPTFAHVQMDFLDQTKNGPKTAGQISEDFSSGTGTGGPGPGPGGTAVPEPASMLLLGSGLGLVAMQLGSRRNRKK